MRKWKAEITSHTICGIDICPRQGISYYITPDFSKLTEPGKNSGNSDAKQFPTVLVKTQHNLHESSSPRCLGGCLYASVLLLRDCTGIVDRFAVFFPLSIHSVRIFYNFEIFSKFFLFFLKLFSFFPNIFNVCVVSSALGSYNKFDYNCYKHSLALCACDSITSFFAGFVVFSVLGFMAGEMGVDVQDIAEAGMRAATFLTPRVLHSILHTFCVIKNQSSKAPESNQRFSSTALDFPWLSNCFRFSLAFQFF